MKVTYEESAVFNPITFTITVESLSDLAYLWVTVNTSEASRKVDSAHRLEVLRLVNFPNLCPLFKAINEKADELGIKEPK